MPLHVLTNPKQLLFCQDTRKSTLRRKNNFPNNCVRTYLRHDIGTHLPKPPSSACCTSHTHAPTRPYVHPTMPSTRHLSLTSQLTNTSPAHMQPGIHQSRPPPNVLRSSHYHHNQNTLTSQLKHPPHTCHPCLTNPTLPPTSLVSKNPKTFLSEMKYVTQMTELEAGQRAMIKAILLRSNRKVSFRYRPWFYVRLQDAVLSGSGLVFLALAFVW